MSRSASLPVQHGAQRAMALSWVALAAGLLPVIVVHLCYLVSLQAGHVPACIPYLSGCTSISAAGRHGAAYFIFKGGMIPAAVAMGTYWVLSRRWLLALGGADTRAARIMVALGVVSAAFLILYSVYLGSKGDFYSLMRRYGVNIHLSFGALAQILLTRELLRLPPAAARRLGAGLIRAKFVLVAALLLLGLASIPADHILPGGKLAVNVIEWWFAAGMATYYLLSAWGWRATGFSAQPAVRAA